MRNPVSLIAWLAKQARASFRAAGRRTSHASIAVAIPGVAVLGQAIGPDRAGRLVPMPDDTIEQGRSFLTFWIVAAAAALIVALLAAGYLRRRWKAAWRQRPE